MALLLSPSRSVAALLILLSPSGTARGVIYGLGRLVGVALVAVLVSLLTEVITVESGSPLVSASLRIALGVALLGFAVVKWLRRPKTNEKMSRCPCGWRRWKVCRRLARRDWASCCRSRTRRSSPSQSAPDSPSVEQGCRGPAVSLALCYTVIACLTVIVPIAAFVVDRDRMVGPLGRARGWLVQNNDTIMSVVFVVIGSMLIGAGVGQV